MAFDENVFERITTKYSHCIIIKPLVLIEETAVVKRKNEIILQFSNVGVGVQPFIFDGTKIHWIIHDSQVSIFQIWIRFKNGCSEQIVII